MGSSSGAGGNGAGSSGAGGNGAGGNGAGGSGVAANEIAANGIAANGIAANGIAANGIAQLDSHASAKPLRDAFAKVGAMQLRRMFQQRFFEREPMYALLRIELALEMLRQLEHPSERLTTAGGSFDPCGSPRKSTRDPGLCPITLPARQAPALCRSLFHDQ